MASKIVARLDSALESLQNIVIRRLGAEHETEISHQEGHSRYAGMTDFSKLPGQQELGIQRSLAAVVGLANPFFKVHQGRAGATSLVEGHSCANFSSYDYLGLNGHVEVQEAARAAIGVYGTSCSASRLVAGERPLHRELEASLASHYGQESAILFVSGYATNLAAIGTLLGPKDLVIYDSLAHNSIIVGAALSGAERRSFAHNDLAALDALLAANRWRYERVLIAVEGLYSMDGDYPDLPALVALKNRYGAWLMVDEAHSLGVLGDKGWGLFEHFDVDPCDVDIWMGTLSKTLAGSGGYIAGSALLVDYLKCMAGAFVYSVGLSPPIAAASLKALEILHREPARVQRLRHNSQLFWKLAKERNLDVGTSKGYAIVPIITGNSLISVALSQKLFESGINAQPIIHPAVPERCARLRFFLTAEHTQAQIEAAIDAVLTGQTAIGDGRSLLAAAR
ncbi:MAG: aminotransferase class I/II-fold pyridoxal phosphate-dependent enzyme [Methylovirgula sp.]